MSLVVESEILIIFGAEACLHLRLDALLLELFMKSICSVLYIWLLAVDE
ncbi:MAG: hypothetical protein KAT90_15610 [Gammaproteobacteria bacterium]|nr:hypothetical protein [Gammaproteobacteria bacterium]